MKTYNVKEIAELLNTNPETVRRWIRKEKLGAVEGSSRKSGKVVTEAMLDTFLKNYPKYASVAGKALSTPIGITAATATLMGSILTKQLIKNNRIQNAEVESKEIISFLLSTIKASEEVIEKKEKAVKELQDEILIEKQKIDEARELIKALESENDFMKGDDK